MIPVILAVMGGAVLLILFMAFRFLGEHKKNADTTNWHISSLKNELTQKEKETEEAIAVKDKLQKELDSLKRAFTEKEQAYQEIKTSGEQWEKEAEAKKELTRQLEQQKKQIVEQTVKCGGFERTLQNKQEEIAILEQKIKQFEENTDRLNKELSEARKEAAEEKQKAEPHKKELSEKIEQGKRLQQKQMLQPDAAPQKSKEETAPLALHLNALLRPPGLKKDISEPTNEKTPQERAEKTEEKKQEQPSSIQEGLTQKTDSPFSRFLKPKISEEKQSPAQGEENKAE